MRPVPRSALRAVAVVAAAASAQPSAPNSCTMPATLLLRPLPTLPPLNRVLWWRLLCQKQLPWLLRLLWLPRWTSVSTCCGRRCARCLSSTALTLVCRWQVDAAMAELKSKHAQDLALLRARNLEQEREIQRLQVSGHLLSRP